MIGILLISHGDLAIGIKNSAEMFFSNRIDAFDTLVYNEEIELDKFDELIKEKIEFLNDGSSVIILGDLVGGTPVNRAISLLNDHVFLIAGFNFNLLINLLIKRNNVSDIKELNINELLEEAKTSIVFINDLLEVL